MTEPARTANANDEEHRRELATKLNLALQGRLNVTGTVTLLNGTTSTVITNPNIWQNTVVALTPLSAAAATAHGSIYVSARGAGTLTLTHANPGADAAFAYTILG